MKYYFLCAILILSVIHFTSQEEVRLIDLDPQDAQQIIEQQDTSLKYAPKIESNVPAVRYLGNKPHNVAEDIYLANQYHGQDGLGGYLYGYSVPDIAKTEKKKAGGDLRGAYNYIAGNGQEIKVEYWDDGTGFHQIDNVPKNLPEDLPEVKKAKEEFMRIWHEQAERNMHPVEDPYNSEGQYKEGPLSKQGQIQRQQQFAAQFGKNPNYQGTGGYQSAASQQSSIYQSNLEKVPQTHNPNYQAYQGRDQQNQGAYQSKQFSSASKGPSYGSGTQGIYQGNQGQGTQGFAKANAGATSGYGQISQGIIGGGYGANAQAQAHAGAQSQNSGSYGGYSTGGSSGYGKESIGSQGGPGYGGQNVAGGYEHQNQWNQPTQKTAAQQFSNAEYQTQYHGQSSQNVNKYAPQPQTSSYGSQSNIYNSKSSNSASQEDDGQYHEENEEKGPPKGFFYKFDYPVGIIVSKQGPAQEGVHQGGGYHHQQKEPGAY